MKLPESEAHIWYFNSNDFDELDRYLQLLSQDELERVNRFKFEKDRKTYILARGLLRILSERYLNIDASELCFVYNEFGKPSYDLQTLVRFNVSHSGELIVLAFVTKGEVGVDVEHIKTNFDIAKIAEGFFSKDEVSSLLAFSEAKRAKAFFNCWTRKEAFIKAKGVGLSFDLTSFSVSINENSPELLRTQWNPNEKNDWKLFSFVPQEGYCSALSVSSAIQKVTHFCLADLD